MIALTQSKTGEPWALVAAGQRFEFTSDWGPLLAGMLDEQWPECPVCGDRVCTLCPICEDYGCQCQCD